MLRRPQFPIRQMDLHYWLTFTGYIQCFCATTLHDLVILTFELLTLRVFHVQCFSSPTHIPIFIILWLSVTELRLMNIWSHFNYLKQSLRMCHVTWPITGGAKIVHISEISEPNLCIHFVTFRALRRKLSHAIGENSVYPISRLHSSLRMRSITWPVHRGSPKTTRNYFLTPTYLFTIQLLWGYDDD